MLKRLQDFAARQALRPDFARGTRCMLSFMAPLVLATRGRLPFEVAFCAIAAQSIANVDVKGPYGLRFTLLGAKSIVIAASASLGALTGNPLWLALGGTLLIAIGSGVWRRLSADYGPSLAVASALVFYVALAGRQGARYAESHFVAAFIGGLWGTALQVAFWPFRAQHPLRVAVADSWLAAADLCAAIAAPPSAAPAATGIEGAVSAAASILDAPGTDQLSRVGAAEAALRVALERAWAMLAAVPGRRRALATRLEALNRAAARLSLRLSAFYAARDLAGGSLPREAAAPLLTVLENLSRTTALAVVSRQPAHLATVEVRLVRARHLAQVLQGEAEATPGGGAAAEALRELAACFPELEAALRATIDRAGERAAFSLELYDLRDAPLKPLAASLNFHGSWDRNLLRFVFRISTLTVIGVALMKRVHLPHGYWLPFTMVVVLQPDFGSTRQKAAQRLLGTLAGSIAASALLRAHLPFAVLMATIAVCCFVFGYYLRRNYALAVIFITLFVVALTESEAPQTFALTAERLGCTFVGGALALLAAVLFWPVWERDRVRPILARGLRANADLLRQAVPAAAALPAPDAPAVNDARRRAQSAGAEVFASLQRMAGDPKAQQGRLGRLAAIANGHQRITRALNLALLEDRHEPATDAERRFAAAAEALLDALAAGLESGHFPAAAAAAARQSLRHTPPRFAPAAAEIGALLLATEELSATAVEAAAPPLGSS